MSIKGKLRELKLYLAKRKLENELSKTIDLMNGHKETSVPSGSRAYAILNKRAYDSIAQYRERATVLDMKPESVEDIEVGVPALKELRDLAAGTEGGELPRKAAAIVVGGLVGSMALTVLWAFNHDLYLLLTHWANAHWLVR